MSCLANKVRLMQHLECSMHGNWDSCIINTAETWCRHRDPDFRSTCVGELQDGLAVHCFCCEVVQSQGPDSAEYPDIALQLL